MDEINLLDYIRFVTRRKWTVVGVTGIIVVVTAIVLMVMPRTYEGETTLLLSQQGGPSPSSQLIQYVGFSLPSAPSGISGQEVYVTVLKSRTIYRAVCKRLHLERYGLKSNSVSGSQLLTTSKPGGLVISCQVPTSYLRGHVPNSELKKRTAELAARMANAYVDELRVYDQTNALFVGKKNRLFIEEQLARTRTDLAADEVRLQRFQEEHPTLVPPEKSSRYPDEALNIMSKQIETDIALSEAEGQLARARVTWSIGAPTNVSPEAVADSSVLSGLRGDLAKLEVKRATLLENFTDSHPDVVGLTQEIDKTHEKVRSEVERVISGRSGSVDPAHQELLKQLVVLEVNQDGLRARRSALAGAMSHMESQLTGLPAEEIEYARRLRDMRSTEVVYTTLLTEHAKARIAEGQEADRFIVLDAAEASTTLVKPKVKLMLSVALMMGVMLGVMVASTRVFLPGKRSG